MISAAAAAIAYHYFPQAFAIVALDITMDREAALERSRAIMTREGFGPADYQQAASFTLDEETQTFVELEGGGKEAFTRMLRERLYSAYTWRVRHFHEGNPNETLIRFTPEGQPYGFVQRLKEDAPGAALGADAARRIAEDVAQSNWQLDLKPFALVEQAQERRPGGRVDHTFTYERAAPTLNEGRYRLRLVVAGDRLTELTHFIRIPQAFGLRYQSMRSRNEAIGIGSVVGMVLLYVVGGIGVGLFFMLRKRWVVWRPAVVWGVAVGAAQALAAINDWPLMWMNYDTAVPRATFLGQQIAIVIAMLLGFSAFFALSFMAAETLTRRAFGSHPQLWRVWSKGPGSSTAILGRTTAAYLLVAVFFAYDVLLYLIATRAFGWWAPSEALLHPDVLASYVPWLSAIANSFQAGFWEESLFRAVPIAGAALIGDRFGRRGLFIAIAFVVQAVVFGAGHAPYPTQPSYARPVELILPSFGFGLLYLYFGLLPGIILHYTFDVIWFALPIFLAQAPGIWIQKAMILVMTFVPLWLVLWRRAQVGAWTELLPSDRNAAFTPPAFVEREAASPVLVTHSLGAWAKPAWLALGAAGLVVCVWAIVSGRDTGTLEVRRGDAAQLARTALEQRGAPPGPTWRVLPMPDDGAGDAEEFVSQTAGEARRRELTGVYLPKPRWIVRVATWQGDTSARAEEWRVAVDGERQVRSIQHVVPDDRAGASLEEDAARALAQRALEERTHLSVAAGNAREVSARPTKQKARTDWTFTFTDTTIAPLPQGEPRIDIQLAGDEVASVRRFIFIPEDYLRRQRAAQTRNMIITIVAGVVFGGLLVAAAVTGVIAWSRRQYAPRLFLAAAAVFFLVSLASAANRWPSTLANLPTAVPLQLALIGIVGVGLVALVLTSALTGLAMGAVPRHISSSGQLSDLDTLPLGVGLGLFGAGVGGVAAWLRVPAWAHAPAVAPLGTIAPVLDVALAGLPVMLTRTAVLVTVLAFVHAATVGWSRRRSAGILVLAVIGFLSGGAPAGIPMAGWALGGALIAAALVAAYVWLLRADLTLVPLALGTMMAVGTLARYVPQPFPGAAIGAVLGAFILLLAGWCVFRALRAATRVPAVSEVSS
jgi:hypothetical protein